MKPKTNNPVGDVLELLPNGQFRVLVEGREVRCYTSGKMRINKINVVVGDRVEVVLDGYGNIGRVVRRK